jgi:hypothetical protein
VNFWKNAGTKIENRKFRDQSLKESFRGLIMKLGIFRGPKNI